MNMFVLRSDLAEDLMNLRKIHLLDKIYIFFNFKLSNFTQNNVLEFRRELWNGALGAVVISIKISPRSCL